MSIAPDRLVPYAGLRPFRSDEDYLFFGREEQTAELVRLLREHRFLAVVGRSGSGKSSLVRAGLLPEIQGGMMQQAGSAWEIAILRPGGHPVRNLAESLVGAELYDGEDEAAVPRLLATLNHSALGLVEAVRQSEIERDANLLVVVDQFEELFRFEQHDARAQDEAHAFVELLLEASRSREIPIYVVLTMRSDYLGDCAHVPGLAEAVNHGEYLIPRLDRNQLRAAIEGPAKVGGATMSYRLVQHLLNELGDEEDQLPILQHALMRTWSFWENDHGNEEEVDLRHYEGTGGMQEAISNHADEIFEALPDDRHRAVAERIFRSLTVKGEDNRGVRRPTRLDTLAAIAGEDLDILRIIIDAYRRQGVTFLMPGEESALEEDTVIDLSHESLMRVWQRLRRWVDDEAQSARIYQRLGDTAQLWKEGQAGLYHDPDLSIAQSWREDSKPNAAWAELYGGGFETATAFLDESHEAAAREERKREEARQRELEQAQALAESQARTATLLKRFAVTVGAAAVLAIALAVWAAWESSNAKREWARAELQTERANEAKQAAQSAADLAQQAQGRTWLANGRALLDAKNSFGARLKALRALGFAGAGRKNLTAAQRESNPVYLQEGDEGWQQARSLLHASSGVDLLWRSGALAQHPAGLNSVAASPDGNFVASTSEGESVVRIWDAAAGSLLTVLQGTVSDNEVLGFSPDSRFLALAGDDEIEFWEIANGEFSRVTDSAIKAETPDDNFLSPPDIRSMAFSPDGETLALGDGRGRLYVWKNWRSFRGLSGTPVHEALLETRVVDLEFDPSGKFLASVARQDGTVKLLDGTSFKVIDELTAERFTRGNQTAQYFSVSFSADGTLLAAAGQFLPVTVWNVADGTVVTTVLRDEWDELTAETIDGQQPARLGFRGAGVAFSKRGAKLAVGWQQTGDEDDPELYTPTVTLYDLADDPASPRRLMDLPFPAGAPAHLAYTAADRNLLAARHGGLDQGTPGRLYLWDLEAGDYRAYQGQSHDEQITSLCFSRDGLLFASGDGGGTLRIWEARTGTLLHSIAAHHDRITELCFSVDARMLFSAGHQDNRVRAWSTETGEEALAPLESDQLAMERLVHLELTPTGESLVVGGWSKDFHFYDPATFDSQKTLRAAHGSSMQITPDGKQAVVHRNSGGDPEMLVYELTAEGSLENPVSIELAADDGEISNLNNVVFSPDGLTMAVSYAGGFVRTWTREADLSWKPAAFLRMPEGARGARASFDRFGRLLTGDDSGQVRIWRIEGQGAAELLQILPGADAVTRLAASPDGSLIITGSQSGLLQMWFVSEGDRVVTELEGIGSQDFPHWYPRGAHSFAFSRDRRLLFTASRDDSENPNAIQAWKFDADTLTPAFLLEGHAHVVGKLVLSPDERYLATGSLVRPPDKGSIRLWDLETGESRVLFEYSGVPNMVFSPDGNTLACVGMEGPTRSSATTVSLLALDRGGEVMAETQSFLNDVFGMSFTPDGKQFVIADSDTGQPLRIFDIDPDTRETTLAHAFPGNTTRLTQIAVSPDGSFIVSAMGDNARAYLWNRPAYTRRGPSIQIDGGAWAHSAAISPDGSLVAIGGGNCHVSVFRSDGSGEEVARYEGASGDDKMEGNAWLYCTKLAFDSDNRTLFMSFSDGRVVVWRLPPTRDAVDPGRYLDVVELDEPSSAIQWDFKNRELGPPDRSQSFGKIEALYLPILEHPLSAVESRHSLFERYLKEGLFRAAHAVLLAMAPEESADLWPQLSLAMARTLTQQDSGGDSTPSGPLWHLAQSVFEHHPPSLEVQLLLLVKEGDWDQLAAVLKTQLPGLPPEERVRLLTTVFDTLDARIESLLETSDLLAEDDPAVPSRDLLLAASLYRAATDFKEAWETDPWTADATLQPGPPAARLLDRLGQGALDILVPAGSEWNYYDRLGAPAPTWNQPGYDDRTWNSGDSPFGYHDPSRETVNYGTRLRTGLETRVTRDAGQSPQLSYYFRKEFETPAELGGSLQRLSASFLCDDGLAVYLDGEEILRHHLPDGELTPETTANKTVGDEKVVSVRLPLRPLALEPGTHVLAAEIHQAAPGSSDMLFDLALYIPAENTWRSAKSLQTAVSFLAALDPGHDSLPWLPAFHDDDPEQGPDHAFHTALRARILGALELKEDALAIAERRLAELQDSYDPIEVGERKRWLRWKADLLRVFGHPEAEREAVLDDYRSVPPRDPRLDPKMIDLTDYYTNSFYDSPNEVAIPETFVPRKGVSYDLRGIIGLNSGTLPNEKTVRSIREQRDGFTVPDKVEGIAIGQKTTAIHVLLNTCWGRETEAVEVGKFVLHYEDGTTAERPLIFLEDVVDWWAGDGKPGLPREKLGWENPRPAPRSSLAELTWEHPHPDKTITSLDFVSTLRMAGPFLVGITLE